MKRILFFPVLVSITIGCGDAERERAAGVQLGSTLAATDTAAAPLRVDGDGALARLAASGTGTAEDPYVLAGRHVSGHFSLADGVDLDVCFDIANTTRPFVLRDSSCRFAHVGARLRHVANAALIGVSFKDLVGAFGWSQPDGGGENGLAVRIEASRSVRLEQLDIGDIYGGFGTFGTPFGADAEQGRAGGMAIAVDVDGSDGVTLVDSRVRDLWGGAGGAGAVGLFAGDTGGRGGLGGAAIGVRVEGGSAAAVQRSSFSGLRAGAGAAAAVSNVFLWGGGNGGRAGDGNLAAGVAMHGVQGVELSGCDLSDFYGSAGAAGAAGVPGFAAGSGGDGGQGGSAIGVVLNGATTVTLRGVRLARLFGGAGGAGGAGALGAIGGSGGRGGDGGVGEGVRVVGSKQIACSDSNVSTALGGAGAAGAAGGLGAGFLEAQGGDGGNGGDGIGFHFIGGSGVTPAGLVVSGAAGGLGGLGGGVEWISLGRPGRSGASGNVITE